MIASTGQPASTLVFGLGSDVWDRALIYSLVIAAVAAVLVGVSAAGSIMAHKREAVAAEGHLKRYKEAVAQTGAARPDGAGPKQGAETVRRPAEVERPPAEAPGGPNTVQDERAQSPTPKQGPIAVEPRASQLRGVDIAPEQAAALVGALAGAAGNISIDYDGSDTSAQPLSAKLQDAFRQAGWTVSSGIILGLSNPPHSGILLRINKGGATAPQERVVRALQAARIPFDLRADRDPKPSTARHIHPPIGMGIDDVEVVVTGPRS